jgi:hypothetical protein
MYIRLQDLEEIWDYLYWLFEYVILLLLWRKLKKQILTIPQGKYKAEKSRKFVKLGTLALRVSIIDLDGVSLIYPFDIQYNKPIKVIFFSYSCHNKT